MLFRSFAIEPASIVLVTVPVSPVVITVPVVAGSVIVFVPATAAGCNNIVPDVEPLWVIPPVATAELKVLFERV